MPLPQAPGLRNVCVDVHSRVYLPRYVDFLRARKTGPRLVTRTENGQEEDRLVMVDDEHPGQRIGPQVREVPIRSGLRIDILSFD